MKEITGPRQKTVKQLFAVSKNRCAFPSCKNKLIAEGEKVVGKICHIKASKKGGPRYDATQTAEERHGFKNLIIMCPIHHDVIDSDEKSYTVERLSEIKEKHEKLEDSEGHEDISDEHIQNLLMNMYIENNYQYTIQSNKEGQVANIIYNIAYSGAVTRKVKLSANLLLMNYTSAINELNKRREENFLNISPINEPSNYQEHFENVIEYLSIENASILNYFFSEIKALNIHIVQANNFYKNMEFPIGMPIMHAGLRQHERIIDGKIEMILNLEMDSVVEQLKTIRTDNNS